MSEFANIKTIEGWTKKLGELLTEAKKAAQQDDFAKRLDINDRLIQFVVKSRPNSDEIKSMDEIATQTASALMKQTIDERIEAITERTGHYLKLAKELEEQTATNEAKADAIRLKKLVNVVDSITQTITNSKELVKSIENNASDKDLKKKLQSAIKSLEALRNLAGSKM